MVLELSWEEAEKEKMVLVDVRECEELKVFEISNCLHMPLSSFDENTLDKESVYAFFCQSGGRSLRVVTYLRNKGFVRVFSIKGGLKSRT